MRDPLFNWNIAVANKKKGHGREGMRRKRSKRLTTATPSHEKPRIAPDFIFYFGEIAARNKKMKSHSLFSQRLV
jgi:hypothetical protein